MYGVAVAKKCMKWRENGDKKEGGSSRIFDITQQAIYSEVRVI